MLGSVSPVDGFLPQFVFEFKEANGGAESQFVRAVSDYFTTALAEMWLAHDLRRPDEPVALFASVDALQSLTRLMHRLYGDHGKETVALTLLNEAFGARPQGTFARMADATFDVGFFSAWVAEIENGNWESANRMVGDERRPAI